MGSGVNELFYRKHRSKSNANIKAVNPIALTEDTKDTHVAPRADPYLRHCQKLVKLMGI